MKVVTIVGARPQFIKAAPLSHALRVRHREILVHTGQHYDDELSNIFFQQLDVAPPAHRLDVGSGDHGAQTAAVIGGVERILGDERPDWVVVYGDTNSTLGGALAAAKLGLRIAHIEAGLRSFNRAMPEETNRVITDHLSDLLFCTSEVGLRNLRAEGIVSQVHVVGDIMADAMRYAAGRPQAASDALQRHGLESGGYLLATIHRAENTDDPDRLGAILDALLNAGERILVPLHPRTRKALNLPEGTAARGLVSFVPPVDYLDMMALQRGARLIVTDSGGVQKEAYWLGVPCITVRDETEWVETVDAGWNVLTGADTTAILDAINTFVPPAARAALYGDGFAADRIVALLETCADVTPGDRARTDARHAGVLRESTAPQAPLRGANS